MKRFITRLTFPSAWPGATSSRRPRKASRTGRPRSSSAAAARILAPTGNAFAILVKGRGTPLPAPALPVAGSLRPFLEEFSRGGVFQGSIVVGSPYPHGPFLTMARDSPYAVQLGFFLGRMFAPPRGFVEKLDTEVKAAGMDRENT